MRYPLEAARTVRASAREAAQRRLTDAEGRHRSAREATESARSRLAEARELERSRRTHAADPTTAAALLREQAYRDAMSARERSLEDALRRAVKTEKAAASEVVAARRALGGALVEEKVLEKHEGRWALNIAKKKEKATEEELDDQVLART